MSADRVQLEWRGDVAVVRLNDPPSLNALTEPMAERMSGLLDEVAGRARAMILTGAGRGFCSGANLQVADESTLESDAFDAGLVLETLMNPLMTKLRGLPIPWITAVRGPAAGVGASLALAADLIVASDTAVFVQAFARVGLVPDGGSAHLLVRTIGRPRAMELMLFGDKLPAATALDWGLINRVVDDTALESEALALATRLSEGAHSLRLIRRLAWQAVDADWEASLATERELQRRAGQTADFREGVRAFRDKRPARFAGT